MSKTKKFIICAILLVFFATFASLGLTAIFAPEEKPLISISEEIEIKTTIHEQNANKYMVRFNGKLTNNSEHDLEDVVIKIYLNNNTTAQKLLIEIEIDKFLTGQDYEVSTYVYHTLHKPKSVDKVSFSIDDSAEVYIDNPAEETEITDIVIYLVFALVFLVAFVNVLIRTPKNLAYTGEDDAKDIKNFDDDDDDDDDDDKERNNNLSEKDLEIEKLKLEVEKQKLENSKLQQNETLKTCPYCGTVSKSKTLKCPTCGAHLKQ